MNTRDEIKKNIMGIIRDEILLTEGKRNDVYYDTEGHLTVGIGHKVLDKDKLKYGDIISNERVEKFFQADIAPVIEAALDQAEELGELEDDFVLALCQVNYQLGYGWPKKWPNTYKALKEKNYETVYKILRNSKWAKQTPKRVQEFISAIMQEQQEQANKVVNIVMPQSEPVKKERGVTSSEFWLIGAAVIVNFVMIYMNAAFNLGLDMTAMMTNTIPAMFYGVLRTVRKSSEGMSEKQFKELVEGLTKVISPDVKVQQTKGV